MTAADFMLFETMLAVVLGVVAAVVLSRWSQILLGAIQGGVRAGRTLVSFQLLCGGIGGAIAGRRSLDEAAIVIFVSVLLILQVPLDVLTRRLSRTLTTGAFVGILAVLLLRTLLGEEGGEILEPLVLSIAIASIFVALHAVLPNSLGLGDVLLVAPLALAMTFASTSTAVLWLVAASGSGAVHGVVNLIRRGRKDLPFGPHLLGAAWLILVGGF